MVPKTDVDGHNAIVSNAELRHVDLVSCDARIFRERIPASEGDLFLHLPGPKYRASIGKPSHGKRLLVCGSLLQVHVLAADDPPPMGKEPAAPVASITVEYELTYALPADMDCSDRACIAFARHNGVHNAWPFFRELVHSFAGRFGVPPLVVPLLLLGPRPGVQQRPSPASNK